MMTVTRRSSSVFSGYALDLEELVPTAGMCTLGVAGDGAPGAAVADLEYLARKVFQNFWQLDLLATARARLLD
jgi:hypothetical protein